MNAKCFLQAPLFLKLLVPILNASEKDVWQWLDEGIDFGKESLNILNYVNNKSLRTNPSHPVCLFMWLGRIAPKLHPNKSFTLVIPAIQHVWFLSLNGCQQTTSPSHSPPSFRSAFIPTFIPQMCMSSSVLGLGEGRLITVQSLP